MQLHIFGLSEQNGLTEISRQTVLNTCYHIAESTDTSCLVTALYFIPGVKLTRGVYIRQWMDPHIFQTGRGKWAFTRRFPVPENLPDRFRLIRMRLDGRVGQFPREDDDAYGWRFKYQRPEDHLAALLAHELHHYRRYHLNLHEKEGEQSPCLD